jgi:hypothetical protein
MNYRRTETSDRSPNTPTWRAVWALYETPGAAIPAIVDAIMAAAGADYRVGLADPAVQIYLSVLLDRPESDDRLAAAAAARHQAVGQLSQRGLASFYANVLADLALHRTILRAGLPADRAARARAFLVELTEIAVDYLAARDLSGYVGRAAIPNVAALTVLKKGIGDEARQRAARVSLDSAAEWTGAIAALWG